MSPQIAILDDDTIFAETLARRLTQNNCQVSTFHNVAKLMQQTQSFSHLVLDLNLGNDSVLSHLEQCRSRWPEARIVILTGYGSIATTVAAMKRGADDYLTKPLNFKELLTVLGAKEEPSVQPTMSTQPMTPAQLEWEHIQQTLIRNDGNISATARELKLHRRTLQRKLLKRPVMPDDDL